MRVVVAPDKFKGSLTALEVARAVGAGLTEARPGLEVDLVPVADGGDGTVAAALSAGYDAVHVSSVGPTGVPVDAVYARSGNRAVVELAEVVGLVRLPEDRLKPISSSTYGLGVVVRDAIAAGATEIVVGLGGSASTDGGAGMVQAMGAGLFDHAGLPLPPGGGLLAELASVDLTELRALVDGVTFTVACDVDNPLLGPSGAAAVFGPQKGATPEQVDALDAALARFAGVVDATLSIEADASTRHRPGAGAAGGTGYAMLSLLGARLVPGIDLVLDLVGFADRVLGASLCIVGEGSLDEQSLAGKAPVGVADAAAAAGVPVVAVAGRSLLSVERLNEAGIRAVYCLSDLEPDTATSMREAASLLQRVGRDLAEREL